MHASLTGLKKIAKLALISSVLWVMLLGFSQSAIGAATNNQMDNCPFSGHSMSICKTNPIEHIEEWQSMFASIPAKDAISILFVLLACLAIRNAVSRYKFSLVEIGRLYAKHLFRNDFNILNPTKEAFSRGILNPKLF